MVDAKASDSYDELLALPLDEFKQMLAEGEYTDVQGLCKHVGINAKGSRADLESRVSEYKGKMDAGEVIRKSPEGRDGRARSPRPGVGAATLRSVAPSKVRSPTVEEFIGEPVDAAKSRSELPSVASLPGFTLVSDQAAASAIHSEDSRPGPPALMCPRRRRSTTR